MTILRFDSTTPRALADAADANFVVHACWVPQHTAGMHVRATAAVTLADSGLSCDTFNLIGRARFPATHTQPHVDAALAYFAQVQRPFAWWVSPADEPAHLGELLVRAGLQPAETEVAMAVDLATIHPPSLPPFITIRRVRAPADLQAFAQIIAANWTPPDTAVEHFYQRAAPVLLAPTCPQWLYVGYVDGHPVATAEGAFGGGVVGLYNICTLTAYRRQGIGTALTQQLLRDARAAGHHIGVLQAAAAGVGLYTQLGFHTFGDITKYKPEPGAYGS